MHCLKQLMSSQGKEANFRTSAAPFKDGPSMLTKAFLESSAFPAKEQQRIDKTLKLSCQNINHKLFIKHVRIHSYEAFSA